MLWQNITLVFISLRNTQRSKADACVMDTGQLKLVQCDPGVRKRPVPQSEDKLMTGNDYGTGLSMKLKDFYGFI